jgi:CCAAT-binding factor, subunit C
MKPTATTSTGGMSKGERVTLAASTTAVANHSAAAKATTTTTTAANGLLSTLTPSQLAQQNALVSRQNSTKEKLISSQVSETNQLQTKFQQQNLAVAPTPETQSRQELELKALREKHQAALQHLAQTFQKELQELHAEFRKQNAAAEYAGIKGGSGTVVGGMRTNAAMTPQGGGGGGAGGMVAAEGEGGVVASATSPAFLEKLTGTLNRFWMGQLQQMRDLGTAVPQTEHDFKNHNDLPLARIKRIMKSDEDVRMISAEAPVLFAKACEMFILELTLRSWSYSENNKRRTLQKEDIKEAIQRTDIFDFLVDVIH